MTNEAGEARSIGKEKEAGFTLLETILALAISTGLLAALLLTLRAGLTAWETGGERMESAAARRAFSERFSREAASMHPYVARQNGSTRYLFKGGTRRLSFVTTAHSGGFPIPWGGTTRVEYGLAKEGIEVTERSLPEGEKKSSVRTFVFSGSFDEVRFEYLGDLGWEETWDADKREGLPRAVRATLRGARGGTFTVTARVYASKRLGGL